MRAAHIRVATTDDLPAMEEIEDGSFPPLRRSSRRVLKRSLNSQAQSVWMAVAGKGRGALPAGAMVLYHYPRSIRIFSVAVAPTFRGKGIGLQLLQHALNLAHRDGLTGVTLEADRRNHRLIDWYRGLGFGVVGNLKDYYSPGSHAVRMRLSLDSARQGGRSRGRS